MRAELEDMGSEGPFKDFAFYSKFKGKSLQGFAGWSDMVSKDLHFCNT